MPSSTTPGKYPYPLGTEPVKDGDNAIAALAARNAVMTPSSVRPVALNGTTNAAGLVWCPTAFTALGAVVNLWSVGTANDWRCWVDGIEAAAVVIKVVQANGTPVVGGVAIYVLYWGDPA